MTTQHNPWHQRFDDERYMYGVTPNAFIEQYAHLIPTASTIAAFAEGEGRNAIFLAKQGHTVTAFDYAQSGLNKTIQLATLNKVTVAAQYCDLLQDDVPTTQFDAAVMVFGHFHEDDQYDVLNKILHALKPNGLLLIEVYSTKQVNYRTGGPGEESWLYDAERLRKWCEQQTVVHFYTGEAERIEGELHIGLAHVVQFIIKKN